MGARRGRCKANGTAPSSGVTDTIIVLVIRVAASVALSILLLLSRLGAASAADLQIRADDGSVIAIDPATLFHTLASDFFIQNDGTIYVQTGDIPAMWLRDSAAQTLPYVRFSPTRPELKTWIRGVIERQARNINVDPYANAFTADYHVWEHKWEVDSLTYPVLLAWAYYAATRDHAVFSRRFHDALRQIVATYGCEQEHARCSRYHYPGTPTGDVPNTGLIWSGFRPSDDSATYGFNIPQQMAAVTALEDLGALAVIGYNDRHLSEKAAAIGVAVRAGIERYGLVYDFRFGWIYAFETDGLGQTAMMDDANMPNLLSAPVYGYLRSDDLRYRATRRFVLSPANRFYYRGRYAQGLGSPHTPANWIWPLGMIARGLTALSESETRSALKTLAETDGEDGLIHESFDPNDFRKFTRAEFGWGNAMYAELLFRSAAGFTAPSLWPRNASLVNRRQPATPSVVSELERIENDASLTYAFDRAVPLRTVGIESDAEQANE
jgi:meiotically up-regulated gene 157 (Mug157) protein